MAESETSVILLVAIALVAVLGLGLALASFATNESMGGMMTGGYRGGMMGGNTTTSTSPPGGLEWGVLLVSAVFLAMAAVLLVRARSLRAGISDEPMVSPAASGTAVVPPSAMPLGPSAAAPPAAAIAAPPVPEPTLVKLLDEDERRMYLELRDHGGQMYQRDLVALGIFSKAKVTRVLDKLEAKGLLVREAHGMTNLVRLLNHPAR